jgi:multidrug efflux system membrane fusion protein
VPTELRAIGSVTPVATVAVKSQVEGQLAEVRFHEGQQVHRDDLLFVIDQQPFEAAVREADAKLARDRAEAANAVTEAARLARLVKEGIVSTDEYDRATTRAASSAAAVKADEAVLETAKIRLRYCSIRSPIDGRIGRMLVHAGNVVKEKDTTLAVINQIRPVHVEFSVPQADLPAIRRALGTGSLPVTVAVPGDSAAVAGELGFVDNTVDTATGTVLLKATFANPAEELWPGQFVNVTLRLATQPAALLVPAHAVQTGQSGRYVYVVKPDGTAELRAVEVGTTVAEEVVVTSGLAAGEHVVTEGALRLAPGMRVHAGAS